MGDLEIDLNLFEEKVDFGSFFGEVSTLQISKLEFHQACLSKNDNSTEDSFSVSDSTGKRLYAGAHVAIRMIGFILPIFENKNAIELGCGTGIMSLIAAKFIRMNKLVLTDGDEDTLFITRANIKHILPSASNIHCMKLAWGNPSDLAHLSEKFDFVFGCELMYYKTYIPLLVETVRSLVGGEGLFIHCHLFRRYGQEMELKIEFESIGWKTIELPHETFISEKELSDHPEWYRARSLISGPEKTVNRFLVQNPLWIEFSGFSETESEDPSEQSILSIMI